MTARFSGRVALVTGGASGIGAACVRRLLDDGASVAAADVRFGEGHCADALAVDCDVTVRQDVERAVRRTIETFGRLDFLVTCAGIIRDNVIAAVTDDEWESTLATHLRGTFLAVQAAQGPMVEQRCGRIVTVSSISARGNPGQLAYATAKAGIQGLTCTAAIELGPSGITVNSVGPGFIDTPMTRALPDRIGVSFDDLTAGVIEQTPLRRLGRPEDVAGVVAFLCSEDADFMTGQVLYVSGGRQPGSRRFSDQ